MELNFPVPRITEGFIDKVVEAIGGRRLSPTEAAHGQNPNADYVLAGAVAELKILEQEPLKKITTQQRIAAELRKKYLLPANVDLDIKQLNDYVKADYKEIVGLPIKRAVRKAAAQIRSTKQHLNRNFDFGVLIAVNNGFNSLPHDEFDNLVLTYCSRDVAEIDFILCTTVEYHQGDFDAYVFCCSEGYTIVGGLEHPWRQSYLDAVGQEFDARMTEMMRNQLELLSHGKDLLEPVKDIRFERDGVSFVREAPDVPDSRFQ